MCIPVDSQYRRPSREQPCASRPLANPAGRAATDFGRNPRKSCMLSLTLIIFVRGPHPPVLSTTTA